MKTNAGSVASPSSLRLLILYLFWITTWCLGQVQVIDPLNGSYLSGPYEVLLAAENPQSIASTEIFLDGSRVLAAAGFQEKIFLDFGDDLSAHELYARVIMVGGQTFTSKTVRSRALEINLVATSEVILLTAVVKTRRNKFITGLSQTSFSVMENNRKLKISTFHRERLPLDLVLLLDTSSSLRVKGIDTVKAAAVTFLKHLDASDRVSLYEFKNNPIKLLDFTTDRKRLIEQIASLEALGETALFDSLTQGLADLKGRRRGRKALVLFTDGRDSVYEEPETKGRLLRQSIARAQNQEVTLFTIGLGSRVHKGAMERLALETGGRYHHAEGVTDLSGIFAEIIIDLKHQYVLGVVSKSTGSGFQRLDITVRKRGAIVYARKGYTRSK